MRPSPLSLSQAFLGAMRAAPPGVHSARGTKGNRFSSAVASTDLRYSSAGEGGEMSGVTDVTVPL